jgi:hypothetical protein
VNILWMIRLEIAELGGDIDLRPAVFIGVQTLTPQPVRDLIADLGRCIDELLHRLIGLSALEDGQRLTQTGGLQGLTELQGGDLANIRTPDGHFGPPSVGCYKRSDNL